MYNDNGNIIKMNLNELTIHLNSKEQPINETYFLNPIVELANRLGYIVIPEPWTKELHPAKSKNLLLRPDLLLLRRVSTDYMLAFIVEAKIRKQDLKLNQIYQFTTTLYDFNHILIVPQYLEKDVLKIASSSVNNFKNVCIIIYDYRNSLLKMKKCNINLIPLKINKKDTRLMILSKLFATMTSLGPITSNTINYSNLYVMYTDKHYTRFRMERIRALNEIMSKMPQLESIRNDLIQVIRLIYYTISSKNIISKFIYKPFAITIFHLIYGLSTARLSSYCKYKLPKNFYIVK